MTESHLLSQISAAFEPYVKSPHEYHNIQVAVAKYIDSLEPQETAEQHGPKSYAAPGHITGIRKRYLEALQDNISARQNYTRIRDEIRSQKIPDAGASASSQAVRTHLDLLALRRQYSKYLTLSHYISEVEDLAKQKSIFKPDLMNEDIVFDSQNFDSDQGSALLAQTQELNRNLEVAILQANHQLKQERYLLEQLKTDGSIPEHSSPAAKCYALEATQIELTEWIEESLAKCDNVDKTAPTNQPDVLQQKQDVVDHEKAIDEQYDKYLEARANLLDAATDLATPIIISARTDPIDVQQALQKSKPVLPTYETDMTLSFLSYLDVHHLPLLQQHQDLDQVKAYINGILSKHRRDLNEQLRRLNDESHLLPAYPILVKTRSDQGSSEADQLLRAWMFAMEAAGTATNATVTKQLMPGVRAVEEVNTSLDEHSKVDKLWAKLET